MIDTNSAASDHAIGDSVKHSRQQQGFMRQLVDPAGVAVEDAVAGDLNADGRIEIIAVGRATHNVRIYWNEKR
jgi:hypothetical protein